MEPQTVQEYNGDTGTWDTVPPEPVAVVEDTKPVVAPTADADEDAPPVAAKVEKPVEAKAEGWTDRRPTNAEARKDPQARIAQQTWDQRESERRADAAERDRDRLKAQLDEARRPKTEPVVTAPAGDKFPDYATHLQTHPEATLEQWLDARDDWRDAKQTERVQTQQLEQAFTTQAQTFSATYAKAVDADPDLAQRIDQHLLTVRPFSKLTAEDKQILRGLPPKDRDVVAFRCFLADQWIDSDHAVQVLEYLSDPTTFQRLATLPPTAVVRDLAKYEAGLSAASSTTGSAPTPPQKAKSATTPPIQPVGSSPHVPDDAPSDTDSDDEWLRKENARELRRRRGN